MNHVLLDIIVQILQGCFVKQKRAYAIFAWQDLNFFVIAFTTVDMKSGLMVLSVSQLWNNLAGDKLNSLARYLYVFEL